MCVYVCILMGAAGLLDYPGFPVHKGFCLMVYNEISKPVGLKSLQNIGWGRELKPCYEGKTLGDYLLLPLAISFLVVAILRITKC